MRSTKLSKYERVAGLFVLVAILGAMLTAISVAVKQGWFETKVNYTSTFENAEGLHGGAYVKMAGLTIGAVDDVELLSDNRVKVAFHILEKYQNRVRADSKAQLIRPFIIGDRVVDITVGSENQPVIAEHGQIRSEETMDLMTVMSGKSMGSVFSKVGTLMESMQIVAEAFSDRERMASIIRMFDRMEPMIGNLDSMSQEVIKLSRQATRDNNLQKTLANAALLTQELNVILPELNRQNPELAQDLAVLTRSLSKMTSEMEVALSEVGPEGRSSAKRAVEALNEATVLMKALQKSFFLRSSVQEVRQEESKDRMPAAAAQ